ncbi:MAG TPA: hypothetical protein VHE53_00460, partial [Patescibacteria group bacterium]|nr:hypothetical protein [Patescibacteria group bacterium]
MAIYRELDSAAETDLAVRHRVNGILDARKRISDRIWGYVEKPSRLAYDHLNAALDAGVNISAPDFIKMERDLIRMALPVITANLQDDLVRTVMHRMLDLTRMSSARRHTVELFPKSPVESRLDRRPTLMDLAKNPPEELIDAFSMVDERTRHVVASSIVVPDELARIGLTPVDFYSTAI